MVQVEPVGVRSQVEMRRVTRSVSQLTRCKCRSGLHACKPGSQRGAHISRGRQPLKGGTVILITSCERERGRGVARGEFVRASDV